MSRADGPLAAAGYLDVGAGNVLLRDAAAELSTRLRRWARSILAARAAVVEPPLFIAERTLERSRYLAHFPQQVVVGSGVHARSRRQLIAPAACLHVYPLLARQRLAATHRVYVDARCARFENGRWRFPFRLAGFEMIELVAVGDARTTDALAETVAARLAASLRELGLAGDWRGATDSFFADRGAAVLQTIAEGKREYRAPLARGSVALASLNRHSDTFGAAFRIRAHDGSVARSVCVAVGLERLTAYGLLMWGPQPNEWPRSLS
jgi:hypothetical protein